VVEFLNNHRQVAHAGKTESDNISLQFGITQGSVLVLMYLLNMYRMLLTFSSMMKYITICLLMTCRVTAADGLAKFLELSLGLKDASLTCLVW